MQAPPQHSHNRSPNQHNHNHNEGHGGHVPQNPLELEDGQEMIGMNMGLGINISVHADPVWLQEFDADVVACFHPFQDATTASASSVTEVQEGLYITNIDVLKNINWIVSNNISQIVICVSSNMFISLEDLSNLPQVDCIQLPFSDLTREKGIVKGYMNAASDWISMSLQSDNKCLVCCSDGINRSSAAIVTYLIKEQNWTLLKAVSHLKEMRPFLYMSKGFWELLMDIEFEKYGANSVPRISMKMHAECTNNDLNVYGHTINDFNTIRY
eukprot:TRINITY_DN862_c0_g1_i3.p1 TRINITY_DN862_c0_g1~~TRINITY_DN862_c0_g1_i3.p1  ORF type:complete len:281 (-),score=39.77 TRINITY_DN862_c0_g1_i3:108-917(-)